MAWFRMALASILLLAAGSLPAQPGSADEGVRAIERIDVTLVGVAGSDEELETLLRSWLAAEPADIVVHRRPKLVVEDVLSIPSEAGTLRIWMVLASQRRARLYFTDPNEQRYLVRDVALRDGLDELGREQLAQVLVSSVQAFQEHSLSSSPAEVEDTFKPEPSELAPPRRSEPKPVLLPPDGAPNRPEVASTHFGAGLSYSAVARGGEGLGHGPGLYLGLLVPVAAFEGTLTLRVGYRLPVEERSDRIALLTQALGTQLSAGLQSQLSENTLLRCEVGAGVEYVTFSPRSLDPDALETRGNGHDLRPLVLFGGRLAYAAKTWELAALLTLSMPLVRTHYDLVRDSEQRVELSPWRLQPGLGMEVGWR